MTTPIYKLGRAFSARRLILLATAGNLAIAALLVGPDSSPQARVVSGEYVSLLVAHRFIWCDAAVRGR